MVEICPHAVLDDGCEAVLQATVPAKVQRKFFRHADAALLGATISVRCTVQIELFLSSGMEASGG